MNSTMPDKFHIDKISYSLTTTLSFSFVFLSVSFLIIASSFQVFIHFQNEQKSISKNQQLIAQKAAGVVANYINKKFIILNTASKFGVSNNSEQWIDIFETIFAMEPAIRNVEYVDSLGHVKNKMSRLSDYSKDKNSITNRKGILKILENNSKYFGHVIIDPSTSEPLVVIAVPVKNLLKDLRGALVAEIKLKFIWDLIDKLSFGESGIAYVVNKNGVLLAHRDNSRVLKGENLFHLQEVNDFCNNKNMANLNKNISKGIHGTKVVSSHVRLGSPDWAVVTEISSIEAFKNVYRSLYISIFIILLLATVAATFGIFLAKYLSAPLLNLSNTANKISNGELHLKVPINGPTEISNLGIDFNNMTNRLNQMLDYEKKQSIELEKHRKHLEHLVEERTKDLKNAQNDLIEKAHRAGMADIATGTLHNVGNILNSVKTSTDFIIETIKTPFYFKLLKANTLLKANIDSLEDFISKNPKGIKLMHFYLSLESGFNKEKTIISKHTMRLNDKVNAIIEAIQAQQSYVGSISLTEEYRLVDIVEDALMMQSGLLQKYHIEIEKIYSYNPTIPIQKNKLLHVLINLITNAKQAMDKTTLKNKKILVTINKSTNKNDNTVFIKVQDTGEGIKKELISKIFTYGFTTKQNGHGYGLHSSANYMTEMGGQLIAQSDGFNKGASFICKLPT